MQRESESSIRALRSCQQESTPAGACGGCRGGICQAALACHMPEPEPRKPPARLHITRAVGLWICAGLAAAGLALFVAGLA